MTDNMILLQNIGMGAIAAGVIGLSYWHNKKYNTKNLYTMTLKGGKVKVQGVPDTLRYWLETIDTTATIEGYTTDKQDFEVSDGWDYIVKQSLYNSAITGYTQENKTKDQVLGCSFSDKVYNVVLIKKRGFFSKSGEVELKIKEAEKLLIETLFLCYSEYSFNYYED